MFEEMLKEFGLTPNEAKVYEALLSLGEATTNQLTLKSKVHRSNVYDALNKLMEKGLVSEVFMKGEKRVKAVHPRRILEMEKEKETMIEKTLPKMEKLFFAGEEKEEAYMYKGIEGVKNYLNDILKAKQDLYTIGAKGLWLDERLKYFLPKFQKERKRLGLKFKHIFDFEVKKQAPEILKLIEKPYKFLPKEYSSKTAVDIFGDYVVTFVGMKPGKLPEEPIVFVMKSKVLADGYRKFFEFMWDKCED